MIGWKNVKDEMPKPIKKGEAFQCLGQMLRQPILIFVGRYRYKNGDKSQVCLIFGTYDFNRREWVSSNGHFCADVEWWIEFNNPDGSPNRIEIPQLIDPDKPNNNEKRTEKKRLKL